jgi:putative ABC transport system substrate-binding protein
MNVNLGGKLLDVLKDIVPKLGHVAILRPASSAASDLFLKDTEMPAQALKIKVTALIVRGTEDYESAFRSATKERVQALVVGLTPGTSAAERKQIIEFAAKNRLPAIYDSRDWAEYGGLISYGADRVDMHRRAATYVDKILKGAKPADLPIQQPTKFELVINLRTAKKLGLTIPQSILLSADKVIE